LARGLIGKKLLKQPKNRVIAVTFLPRLFAASQLDHPLPTMHLIAMAIGPGAIRHDETL
jgi:hypothetical protein